MRRNFKFLAVLLLFLTGAGLAHALQCKSGSSSCSSSSASDCTNLGYSSSAESNCKHYLLCPFNTSYKTCVAFDNSEPEPDCSDYPLTECPDNGICDECPDDKTYLKFTGCESGYVLNADKTGCEETACDDGYAKSVDGCGMQGKDGWHLGNLIDTTTGCYRCMPNDCKEGYSTDTTDCGNGYTLDNDGYSGENECGMCICTNPCEDTYTGEIPENAHAVTETCNACDEEKEIVTGWECDGGFSADANKTKCLGPCDKSADEHCKTWSSELEDCECTECEEFYEKKDGKCVPMTCDDDNETADDCKDTETYIVDKTLMNNEVCGHCVDCTDENDPHSPCKGMYTCSGDGRVGVGTGDCPCGNVTYYKKCQVVETCGTEYKYENGGSCYARTQNQVGTVITLGEYLVGDKCTKIDLTKVYWYASCTGTNCEGNDGPAYGLKECPNGAVGSGKTVECGNITYYEECDCDTKNIYENGGKCYAYTQNQVGTWATRGKYLVGDKCTMGGTGTKVYKYADCTTEKDCEGNPGLAYGLKTCPNGEVGSGKTVECGDITYYEECGCDTEYSYENGGSCYAYTQNEVGTSATRGKYLVGDKCTTNGGTKVYWYASCTGTNCEGNKGPAYGLKKCDTGYYAVGTIVECGGDVYGSDCAATCNYELQASDCAENQTFVARCRDYNNVEFGECVDN